MSEFTFHFQPGDVLTGEQVELVIEQLVHANPTLATLPAYRCRIRKRGTEQEVGSMSLRLGYSDKLVRFAGHIGYTIDEEHRGHGYARKACALVNPIFEKHGMDVVWITCNPDNVPSVKTCEGAGFTYVDTVALPSDSDMYERGDREKRRYRLVVYP